MSTFHVPVKKPHGVALVPTTRLGRRALESVVVSAGGLAMLFFVAVFGPPDPGVVTAWGLAGYAGVIVALMFAVTAAVAAVVAIFRHGERAFTVYLALVPLLSILLFPLHSLFMSD